MEVGALMDYTGKHLVLAFSIAIIVGIIVGVLI